MADLFEDVNFAGDTLYVSNVDDFAFFKDFDGDFLSRDWVDTKLDFAEGALPEIFGNYVVSDGSGLLEGRLGFLHEK